MAEETRPLAGWTADHERVLEFVRRDRIARNIVVGTPCPALHRESDDGYWLFGVLPHEAEFGLNWQTFAGSQDLPARLLARIEHNPNPVL